MTNKERIKLAIDEDINPNNYYNEIINVIKKDEKIKRNSMWRWTLVPLCLIVIIGGIISKNPKNDKNMLKENVCSKEDVKLNINILDKESATRLDIDVKEIETKELNVLKDNITIPEDLNKFDSYAIYGRKDKTSEYNILNSYVYRYFSENEDKSIRIAFSKTNEPIRDFLISDEESKVTSINNTELRIFKYNNLYFTKFKYKDYYFDIETNNISEKELSNLLVSIII